MRWVPNKVYDFYRKNFGSFELEDPRELASASPYTYYLPPPDHKNTVRAGDLVKVIIRSKPDSREYDAERMWVKVVSRDDAQIVSVLDNDPFDIPQLNAGDNIILTDNYIVDIIYDDKESRPELDTLSKPTQKQYWDRCLVDDCVLDGSVRIGYLYREKPDMTKDGDQYIDSGWRIRGDVSQMSAEQYEDTKFSYIALGKVLNVDDSWLMLIDSPIGTAFSVNESSGKLEPTEFTGELE